MVRMLFSLLRYDMRHSDCGSFRTWQVPLAQALCIVIGEELQIIYPGLWITDNAANGQFEILRKLGHERRGDS